MPSSAGGGRVGPIPLYWLVAAGLYGMVGGGVLLLLWVTVKPFVRPSPAWLPKPSVKLDLGAVAQAAAALTHRRGARAQYQRRRDPEPGASAWLRAKRIPCELTLLHVVDTAMTRVLGSETADRESDADERYLADLVDALRERGYRAKPVLLHGPNPAEELVRICEDIRSTCWSSARTGTAWFATCCWAKRSIACGTGLKCRC